MKKMIKQYKEKSPLATVNKIRKIMNEVGIFVKEEYQRDGDYHTCRLEIANDKLLKYHMGTNGKGITAEYCYASAYGEFMERLQNKILLKKTFFFSRYFEAKSQFAERLQNEKLQLDFIFDPKEKILTVDDIIKENSEVLMEILPVSTKKELKDFICTTLDYSKALCVPFYNKSENKINYLPIEILFVSTGSNGMCAGNTPEEALVQGICEIFERYASRVVYKQRITPPTIPHEYFAEYDVYHSIKQLEDKGYKIIIKDFSLGKNLPVIAVIIIDQENNRYNIKVGSDPWPPIALERCLTELHQSFSGVRLIDWIGFGDFIVDHYKNLDREEAEHISLRDVFTNASGQWPDSIFGENNSYKFEGMNFSLGKSNNSDLKYLVSLIEELGFRVLFRDVSYLGLNSYYVVVPGMSMQKNSKSDYTIFNDLNIGVNKLDHFSMLSEEEMVTVTNVMESKYLALKHGHIDYKDAFLYSLESDAYSDLDLDLFLSIANYRIGRVSKAHSYLGLYLKDKNRAAYLYFFACKDFLALKKDNCNEEEIRTLLSKIYSGNLVSEVIDDMKDRKKIFKSYNLQSYFYSNSCNIADFDYYSIAPILKKMENKHRLNPINQLDMAHIFSQS